MVIVFVLHSHIIVYYTYYNVCMHMHVRDCVCVYNVIVCNYCMYARNLNDLCSSLSLPFHG